MAQDPELITRIESAIRDYRVDVAIETGTYQGTGSTRMIAECFNRVGRPKLFVTFEVGFGNWLLACRNLRGLPFVECRWGCSVDREKAVALVQDDEMLAHHERYPDIFIDDTENPIDFYTRELRGKLAWQNLPAIGKQGGLPWLLERALVGLRCLPPMEKKLRDFFWSGEGLLPKYLQLHHDNKPLIILDSAGGCGWYEFQLTMEIMGDAQFLLLLDDTHHIKHYRSLQHVKADPRFQVLSHSPYHGSTLAWHA
jgi:hypothetical protein